ncbi:MAG: glycoside hydrolase family 140 protein [Pegethrix bostrychoides GSE-TBD4-15B]|uniref:Glycoside hydrolase family 140 protein n=1 Tax=Pegethrix bostrychoides GSE-TBD4-15B TaxID=2839662 RepID=A0A951P736_9CYAN|nr:glycoside hydrolase family 140 protein [Pegethrix bostrychoides GSE-TBD4-15B]
MNRLPLLRQVSRRNFLQFSATALLASLAKSCAQTVPHPNPSLRIDSSRRWLTTAAGQPFFYLGDTAWELFHRLNRAEADRYLQDRASKGFTVIQAVVLAELDGLGQPNAEGNLPLEGHDPTRPNDAYFQHVDYIVEQAAALGLYVGMLPTWGDKWRKGWGVGPEIFTPENAETFGAYLGQRYQNQPIIWILGGDRNPETAAHFAIIRAMAKGLKQGDGGRHLLTYHPVGGSSSAFWFHQDRWLDFNLFQSGHSATDFPNYQMTQANYQLRPAKPNLDGEPRYEDHPINWQPEVGRFNAFDVRQAAYWSMLSGACGHTYGNHNIWQMWQPGRGPISAASTPWQEALNHPGAAQMGYMRRLFESRPYQQLVPDQGLILGNAGEGPEAIRSAVAQDGSFALLYTPMGKAVTVDLTRLSSQRANAFWYDPRQGTAQPIGQFSAQQRFTPASSGRGQDWLLVLDDPTGQFSAPGAQVSAPGA